MRRSGLKRSRRRGSISPMVGVWCILAAAVPMSGLDCRGSGGPQDPPDSPDPSDSQFGCPVESRTGRETGVQVEIEVKFLTVTDTFLDEIGVDLDQTFPLDSASATEDPFAPSVGSGSDVQGFLTAGSGGDLDDFALPALSASGGSTGFSAFNGAFLDDTELDVVLRAVQERSDANLLSSPKLTLLNCEPAVITVFNEFAEVDNLTSTFNTGVLNVDELLSFVWTGPTVIVVPEVTSEDALTLRVQPTLSVAFNTPDVQVEIDGVWEFADRALVQDATVETQLNVQDGQTVLLGGMIRDDQTEVAGVPLLKDVPILGRLFDNRVHVNDETTLLIMVTPTIVLQSEED